MVFGNNNATDPANTPTEQGGTVTTTTTSNTNTPTDQGGTATTTTTNNTRKRRRTSTAAKKRRRTAGPYRQCSIGNFPASHSKRMKYELKITNLHWA